jgi:sRNA-binding protein
MSVRTRVALADDPDLALVKGIALDIGKEVVAYVERMYPQAISACSSTFPLSLRNCIFNEIIDALNETDPDKIVTRLARRKAERRQLKAQWAIIRETDWDAYRRKRAEETKP